MEYHVNRFVNKLAFILIIIMFLSLFLTGCSGQSYNSGSASQDRISELEQENEELQERNESLENSIDEANDQIRDAQSKAGEDYDTMGETLEDLDEVDY